jgi:hypothetical protein
MTARIDPPADCPQPADQEVTASSGCVFCDLNVCTSHHGPSSLSTERDNGKDRNRNRPFGFWHGRGDARGRGAEYRDNSITEMPALAFAPDGATKLPEAEAPAVADVGHLPRTLYTINSNRSRYQIISDYVARHDLSAKQADELVRALPDYGVKSMLAGSVATLRRHTAEVVCLAHARSARAGRR